MYKSRLQELCQQRLWALPEYTSNRDGPDHDPRFQASVTVDGVTFHAPDLSKSSKEAQNKAARVAVEHFSAAAPSPPPPHPLPSEKQISYKSQLQNFVQKKIVEVPRYTGVCEGLPHAPRSKAIVTVDGKNFESSQYFSTLKEAEHDAAKVALMSFSMEENQLGETGFYKNLLQELAQKEGFSLPTYTTVRDGACHMPIFSSTVEVEGESFQGYVAKTKKQAEMNAAKVAWCQLNERRICRFPSGLSSSCQLQKEPASAISSSESAVIMNLHKRRDVSVPVSWVKVDKEDEVASDRHDCITTDSMQSLPDNQKNHSPNGLMDNNVDSHNDQSATVHNLKDPEITMKGDPMAHLYNPDAEIASKKEHITWQCAFSEDGISSDSSLSDGSNHGGATADTEFHNGATCSLLCNRIRVYPRKSDLVLPVGATLLPFSDDKWVAVSFDFSNQEGGASV
ncbi:double-stranded RNA-binding protein 1-like isoform X3 [Phoenix dactylifera]|uniref:Double-stranded RNA-binding protein 1-like isoform X3 n=1 Tax=Phoenix dactylifera TaxID=42345 RepID=A0A8B8ZQK4_PHODC|nr:double-stranded RNA-binding protein 1-like isoform X3 [Phoenix dactylifera]